MSGWLSEFTNKGPTEPVYGETGMMEFSHEWMPHVVGHNTSFGQLDTLHQSNNFLTVTPNSGVEFIHPATLMPPPVSTPPLPTDTNHSPDVVAAATILGGPGGANMSAFYGAAAMSPTSTVPAIEYGPPHGQQRSQPQALAYSFAFGTDLKQPSLAHSHDFTLANIYWGNEYSDRPLSTNRQTPREAEALFGSDPSFNQSGGFRPTSYRDSSEHMMKEQADVLGCLEPADSAATTRASSPVVHNGQLHPGARIVPQKYQARPPNPKQEANPEAKVGGAGSKRRRQSKVKGEGEENEEMPFLKQLPSKRRKVVPAITVHTTLDPSKPTSPGRGGEPTSATLGRRRKPGAGGGRGANKDGGGSSARPTRENLTEEQKRENHIKSEQKRRTMIKDGFDNLSELIPGLTSGGQSKSQMLSTVGDYIVELKRGNEELETLLRGCRGHDTM
ncbi:hypothetical protein B0T25DRAFT_314046 [Lasiosphaeria hispida]|uniref:BHLH domain-containing protein n=1 Tax=Lasiosphaeria hispida TaxID=260671 RepID=A0AAJ0M9W3_9PEZI|nr:hypothetical protein B0T25DRAFT_314046 [Lasiosphaeria hispida]